MSEHRSAQNPDAPQGDQSAEQHNPESAKNPEKLKAEKFEVKEKPEEAEKLAKEQKPEKLEGKVEWKEKPEKFEKNEVKEHKNEKFEKVEFKEHKPEGKIEIKEKPEKFEKDEFKEQKHEIKELKPEKLEFELPPQSFGGPGPVDRETMLRYAAALEKAGQDLRHFIEQSERPDLTHGALQNEPDDQDEPQAGA